MKSLPKTYVRLNSSEIVLEPGFMLSTAIAKLGTEKRRRKE
jgi:hypothetical protein